ncbi:MAG: HAD-IB family phosphatase [Chloroflexi bacterium]|nr:HAD-IB family phosphatase [Chloroflexota bacterium]
MPVVASDLEGTLSSGATWRGIGRYLEASGQSGAYRRFFFTRVPGIVAVRLGWMDRDKFGQSWLIDLVGLFKGSTPEQLAEMGEWVVENELWPKRRAAVIAELEAHRKEGRRVVLASGSYLPVLEAFARRLGAEAIATGFEMVDGRATGRLTGPMTVGPLKAERLRTALNGDALVAAYGDTAADVPMMQMSAAPVAVAPDEPLAAAAREHGWRVMAE